MNDSANYLYGELLSLLELPGYEDDDFIRDLEDYKAGFGE